MTPADQLAAFIASCTGGETDPSLWRLSWLDAMVADADTSLENGDFFGSADPTAAWECIAECRTLARLLWAALKTTRDAASVRQRSLEESAILRTPGIEQPPF